MNCRVSKLLITMSLVCSSYAHAQLSFESDSNSGIQAYDFTAEFGGERWSQVVGVASYNDRQYALATYLRIVAPLENYRYLRLYDLSAVSEWDKAGRIRPAPLPIELSIEDEHLISGHNAFSADGSMFVASIAELDAFIWRLDALADPTTITVPERRLFF